MKVMKWIDVEKRLPVDEVYVLVAVWYRRPEGNYYSTYIRSIVNKIWYDDYNGDPLDSEYAKVTHWMPLPDEPEVDHE